MLMRIHVSNSGMKDINGKYDVCNNKSKYPTLSKKDSKKKSEVPYKPEFMYWHKSNTTKHEYGMFLAPLPGFARTDLVWVIARIDWKKPIIFYSAERGTSNVPPTDGWKEVAGLDPTPSLRMELLQSPQLKSAKTEYEVPKEVLEKALFDNPANHSPKSKLQKQGHAIETKLLYDKKFKQHKTGGRFHPDKNRRQISQPAASAMNRRVGEQ